MDFDMTRILWLKWVCVCVSRCLHSVSIQGLKFPPQQHNISLITDEKLSKVFIF